MALEIIERFSEGKFRDGRNEDRIFTGEYFAAVIDGSSATKPIAGRAGGIIAAELIARVLGQLEPTSKIDGFIAAATTALKGVASSYDVPSPFAATVVYSIQRREIWRVGDCPFSIDGVWNIPGYNPHEQGFLAFRSMMLDGYAKMGGTGACEPTPVLDACAQDWLAMTKYWVNADDSRNAFAAVDDRSPSERFVEVFRVRDEARSLALASDGAIVSPKGRRGPLDAQDMLDQIALLRLHDPHGVKLFPYWRGFIAGSTYLDDTTLLRFHL